MTHDIVIRGGAIVDGTGAPAFNGDIAVDGGKITQVGGKAGPAAKEIDADGLTVTPGFVDIHTHLDAQIGWDPLLTPLSWHGVTTALLGNCGVTFAPCKPAENHTLAAMMETVEDIPREAILGGLAWDWEGYGGYLDSIERGRPAINVAGLVGHSAVRFYVMGERAVEEMATDAEKEQMAAIVARSIDDGAVGFSSNRFPGHVLPDGRSIPGTFADHDEVLRIADVVGERGAVMQNVMDFNRGDMGNAELLRKEAARRGGRILVSYTIGGGQGAGLRAKAFFDDLTQAGEDITAVSVPRGTGFVFGLQSRVPAYNMWGQKRFFGPAWEKLAAASLEERLAQIRDPAQRAVLVAEAKAADQAKLIWLEVTYWLGAGDTPIYWQDQSNHLAALAERAGEHWSETFFRLSLESNGLGLFTWRLFNKNQEALRDWLPDPRVVPGLSDAGAHVSQVMDSGVTSFVLGHWVRDQGLYSLEEGVRRLTTMPARVIGLKDRGALKPGMAADINVLDLAAVGEAYPRLVRDFPGGAPRYIQGSRGYHATLVNGQVAFADGVHAGPRTGQVLRHKAA